MNEQQQIGGAELVEGGHALPELGAAELEALAGYRAQEAMPAAAAERVLASLETTPPVSGVERWLGGRGSRLLLGAVLVTAIPLALWATLGGGESPDAEVERAVATPRHAMEPISSERSDTAGPQVDEPKVAESPVPEEQPRLLDPEPVANPETDAGEADVPPSAETQRRAPSRPRAAAQDPKPDEPSAGGSSLAAEATLLKRAQRAVAGGDAQEALRLVERHADEFEHGIMVEERLVLEVVALCAAGRETRGRAKAERFLARHPKSPSRKRVMEACPDDADPESQ